MRDCANAEVRDRLPELVHGLLEGPELVDVESHVAECSDCAAEAALIRRAAGVIALGAPRVNATRIAAALPTTATIVEPPRTVWAGRALRIAAALLVAVVGIGTLQYVTRDDGRAGLASLDAPLPESGGERAVARPVGSSATAGAYATAQRAGLVLVGGIDALTLDQLELLVSRVETLDAMPSADPEPLPFGANGAEVSR
ncbi:MAG TPA: zf-HC2 domain-containing protein [Gemmatimonadaceae bacterium]|nr:zf-HC2 domain-containing protein [Gemmatimonadaceae bacterium]